MHGGKRTNPSTRLRSVMPPLGLSVYAADRPGLLRDVAAAVAACGGNIEAINHVGGASVGMHFDVSGVDDREAMRRAVADVSGVHRAVLNESSEAIFGKRVIVIGGGAQVAQVVLGAVSEADRHNLRGERISVDTIPLVGEENLAAAVRAVGRLPRVRVLVMAGSLMGGDIATAIRELRAATGIAVISLRMAGRVAEAADLVVTDPVQAGTMAVMAIADTAQFDLARVRGLIF
jgi:energy-converting hydrogenase B subunit Q